MSTPLEIANREADEAELENPDGEEAAEAADAEQETEQEPEPESQGPTESDIRKVGEKIDREDTRHKGRLREILGADFEMYRECPLCQVAGFVLPYPPGAVEPLQRAAVMAALGDQPTAELKPTPGAVMCPVCDGHGETANPSRSPDHMITACTPCTSKGWMNSSEQMAYENQRMERERSAALVAHGPRLSAAAPIQAEPYPDYGVPFVPLPEGVPDQYKRPAGHPMWGSPNRADGTPI